MTIHEQGGEPVLSKFREQLSFANVVSVVALFAALGLGSAWAATELSNNQVKSKHIGAGQVKNADLGNDSVTSPNVADGSLLDDDFAPGQLPAGSQGERGPEGPQGPPGSPGSPGSPDTPQQVLDKAKQVDGSGSGLDTDLLDGLSASAFVQDADSLPGSSDLTGTYANPQVDADAVGGAEVALNSLTDADISNASTLDTDEINEAGLDDIVHTSGISSCCDLGQELLDLGTPFSAGNSDTFVTHSPFQLRSHDDADKVTFCVLADAVSSVFVVAYLSGVRSTMSLGPGNGPLCQTVDINGAATNSIGDFEFRTSGLWMMGVGSSETMVFALG